MKTRLLLAPAITALVFASLMVAVADDAEKKDPLAGLKCPVSGQKCAADTAIDYKEGKVSFCCKNCPKTFAKDTKKYATKANLQLVASGQYENVKCPISGAKLNPKTAITVADAKVAFCCNKCKGKVKKAKGDEQLNLVFADKPFGKGFKPAKKESKKDS